MANPFVIEEEKNPFVIKVKKKEPSVIPTGEPYSPDLSQEFQTKENIGQLNVGKIDNPFTLNKTLLPLTKEDVYKKQYEKYLYTRDDLQTKYNSFPKDKEKPFDKTAIDLVSKIQTSKPIEDDEIEKGYLGGSVNSLYKAFANTYEGIGNVLDDLDLLLGGVPGYLWSKGQVTNPDAQAKAALQEMYARETDPDKKSKLSEEIHKSSRKTNPFYMLSDWYNKESGSFQEMPETISGDVISGTMNVVPLLLELSLTPEVKLAKVGSMAVKIPKLATLEGTKGLYKGTQVEGSAKEKLKSGLISGLEGVSYGTVLHGLGVGSNMLGQLTKNTVLKGITAATANGIGFGGFDAYDQYVKTGEIDLRQVASSAGTGLVLGIPEVSKSIGIKAIEKQAYKKAVDNFMATSDETINMVNSLDINEIKLREKSNELGEKSIGIEDIKEKNKLLTEKRVIDNILDINLISKDISTNPDPYKKTIQESSLEKDQKDILINKIDNVVKANEALQSEIDTKILDSRDVVKERLPELFISEETKKVFDDIELNNPITNDRLKSASDNLYEEYKRLDAVKLSQTRFNTIDEINNVQKVLEKQVINLENQKDLQAENEIFFNLKSRGKEKKELPSDIEELKNEIIENEKPDIYINEKFPIDISKLNEEQQVQYKDMIEKYGQKRADELIETFLPEVEKYKYTPEEIQTKKEETSDATGQQSSQMRKKVDEGEGVQQSESDKDLPGGDRAELSDRETTGEKIDETHLIISSDAKTGLLNGRKKQVVELDESGNQIVKEIDFSQDDAELELQRLETLAERGKLTISEFQKSYFGQVSDNTTFGQAKKLIESNPVEFIQNLKESFLSEPVSQKKPIDTKIKKIFNTNIDWLKKEGGKENAIQERKAEEVSKMETSENLPPVEKEIRAKDQEEKETPIEEKLQKANTITELQELIASGKISPTDKVLAEKMETARKNKWYEKGDDKAKPTPKKSTKESLFTAGGREIKISFKPINETKESKTFESILKQFSDTTGKGIKFRKKSGGTYFPSSTTITSRSNDLRVASHEIGHYLDDKFSIVESIPKDRINEIHKELSDLSRSGSKPGMNIENKDRYIKSEGIGEWTSVYVANPVEAERLAPEFTKLIKEKIDTKHLKALDTFSDDIGEWYSLPVEKRVMYGVQMQEKKPTLKEKIYDTFYPKEFKKTSVDQFTEWFANPNVVYEKAYRELADRVGYNPLTDKKSSMIENARNLYGLNNKTSAFYKDGMQDFAGKDIKVNNEKINGEWLIDPIAKISKSKEELDKNVDHVVAVGISERVIELNKNKERKQIIEDLKNGRLPFKGVLDKHPDIVNEKIGQEIAGNIIDKLRNEGKKEEYWDRYDFTNDNYTSSGGGFIRSYDEAVETLLNYDQLKQTNPEQYKAVFESLDRYRKFSDEILKYALDGGRITKDQYDHIKKNNQNYISFGRIESNDTFGEYYPETEGTGKTAIGVTKKVINKIKGSRKTIQNPYVSLMDNLHRIVSETDRNAALRDFTKLLDTTSEREIGEAGKVIIDDIGTRINSKEEGKNVLTIFDKDGEKYYDINKDIYDSLKQVGNKPSDIGILSYTLGLPVRLIEKTVTTFPVFAARNRIRDFGSRLGLTQAKFKFSDLTQKKKYISELNKKGGGQFGYMMNKSNYYMMQSEIMKQAAKQNHIVLNPLRIDHAWSKYLRILERSEQSTRAEEYKAVYEKYKKEGWNHKEASAKAAFAARDLMDFSVSGNLIKYLRWTAPFINPRIQGVRKLVNTAKTNPKKLAANFMIYAVTPILMEKMLISLADRDDDYVKLHDFRKDMFYNLPNPFGDGWITIPKPFELGILASASTRWLDKILFDDKRPYESDYVKWLFQSISPVDENTMTGQSNPIKNAIQNKDPFRQTEIIPEYEVKKPLVLREGTKYASRWGQQFKRFGVDPRMADYLTKSMFTYYGDLVIGLSDIGREDKRKYDITTKTGFYKQDTPYNNKDFTEIREYVSKYNKYQDKRYVYAKGMVDEYYKIKDVKEAQEFRKGINEYFEVLLKELKEEEKLEIQEAKGKYK